MLTNSVDVDVARIDNCLQKVVHFRSSHGRRGAQVVIAKMCCHIRMLAWPYTKSVWFVLGTIVSECCIFFGGFQRTANLRDGGQRAVLSIYSNLATCANNMAKY